MGAPNMNAATLTALVDRWRPETHTFHLRSGEMTPTLQDVSMILALPIQGEPLFMNTASDGWRQQMENLIGMAPPEPEDKKDRAPPAHISVGSGLTLWWEVGPLVLAQGAYGVGAPVELGKAALAYLYRQIPDDTILSQGKKQATRSAYMLKPRGKAPNRHTPDDYVNRGKKVVIESDEEPPWRSALRRMRNNEPSSSEEEGDVQVEEPPRTRRKQPARRDENLRWICYVL
ncbi:hypothetical protein QYE76_062698 [Lolium multiflorum]|uniref:Aminotransferase-like plant mobile domain-containing protein n=1 Tax=Lolium multiflorum TaxID=4521 RepID=A0AAD8S4Y8_LOLMU|nr:hypothetical protein QYE76_062698 [Lolium multiflorum]